MRTRSTRLVGQLDGPRQLACLTDALQRAGDGLAAGSSNRVARLDMTGAAGCRCGSPRRHAWATTKKSYDTWTGGLGSRDTV